VRERRKDGEREREREGERGREREGERGREREREREREWSLARGAAASNPTERLSAARVRACERMRAAERVTLPEGSEGRLGRVRESGVGWVSQRALSELLASS
jgi:hypothetical protein